MPTSWEDAGAESDFVGYLKLLDFQSEGYDVHATFPKGGGLPHLSVYLGEVKQGQVDLKRGPWNKGLVYDVWMWVDGVGVITQNAIKEKLKATQLVISTFLAAVDQKHKELFAPKVVTPKPSGSFVGSLTGTSATWGGSKKGDLKDTKQFPSLSTTKK